MQLNEFMESLGNINVEYLQASDIVWESCKMVSISVWFRLGLRVCVCVCHCMLPANFYVLLSQWIRPTILFYRFVENRARLYYSDKHDNGFLLCLFCNTWAYNLADAKMWEMWHILSAIFYIIWQKWLLPFNYRDAFRIFCPFLIRSRWIIRAF